jgi:hypothetical protein
VTTGTAAAQGPLLNGENHVGAIASAGELHEWTFAAQQGDAITVSIGEAGTPTAFTPWIRLRRPDGAQAVQDWGALAAQVTVTAPLSGTYTVVVGNQNAAATGQYQLVLAHTPGTFVVPTGDEGGALTNGANHAGAIDLGDLDLWSFTAAQGDAITVSIGEVFVGEVDPGFVPWIRLRRPDGTQVAQDWGALAAQVTVTAPLSGTYTVVVGSQNLSTAGHYRMVLAHTPGAFVVPTSDEGGAMTNGADHE